MPRSAAAWEHAEKHRPKFIAWLKASETVKKIALANHNAEWEGKEPDEKAFKEALAALTKAHKEMLEEEEAAAKKAEQKKGGKRKTRRRRTTRK